MSSAQLDLTRKPSLEVALVTSAAFFSSCNWTLNIDLIFWFDLDSVKMNQFVKGRLVQELLCRHRLTRLTDCSARPLNWSVMNVLLKLKVAFVVTWIHQLKIALFCVPFYTLQSSFTTFWAVWRPNSSDYTSSRFQLNCRRQCIVFFQRSVSIKSLTIASAGVKYCLQLRSCAGN